MKYITNSAAATLPIPDVTTSKKAVYQSRREYYESKIKCLVEMDMPANLVLLACWDAPVERMDLSSSFNRKRFIKKCLKYYKKRLKEVTVEERKL